jgi:hypothetical protein
LEPEPEPEQDEPHAPTTTKQPELRVSAEEECLLKADKMAAAVLKNNFERAMRLAKEYADLRKQMVGSDAPRTLNKAA